MGKLKIILKDKFMSFLGLLIIVIGLLFYVDYKPGHVMPVAQQGVLNAGKWDFAKQGALILTGEWEFYPSQLISPAGFALGGHKPSFVKVPNAVFTRKTKLGTSPWGYATYRLTIKVNSNDRSMGLFIRNIKSSRKVFLNGRLVLQSGVPAASRDTYRPGDQPQVLFFHPSQGTLTLVVQVANFDFFRTGITSPIVLGTSQQIQGMTFVNNGLDLAAASILGLFGVYYFFLFFLLKRNDFRRHSELLLMGVFFLVSAAEVPFEGTQVIFEIFPYMSYELYWKLKIVLPMAMVLLTIHYLWTTLQSWKFRHIFLIPAAIFLGYAVATVILPVHVMAKAIVIRSLMGLGIITLGGIFFTLLTAYARGRYGQFEKTEIRLYILAVLSLSVVDINDVFYLNSLVDNNVITDIFRVIFAGLVSGLLAFRYYHAFSRMGLLTEKLKRADRLKDDFLIQTAHELKTPLHGIINIIQSLLEEPKRIPNKVIEDAARLRTQQLSLVQRTARRMSRTVNDIMDLARIREGRLSVNLTEVDVRSCFSVMADLFSYQVEEKNLRLVHQVREGAELVWADESRLLQVLSNLVHNSIKHTETGLIQLVAEHKNGAIHIWVEDTGKGIPPKQQETLFAPYEQGDLGGPMGDTGIGLGLFISKELVRVMGGELYLAWSEMDKGSRFVCKLPEVEAGTALLAPNPPKEETQATPVEVSTKISNPEQANRPTILAVDDEFLNLKVLSSLFEDEDYNVMTVTSGQAALDAVSNHKPELILLDVMLPDISGYEVCRLIRQNHSMIELPVLFLTVRNTPDDVAFALSMGGNDFIAKPFEAKEIRARVATLLTMKQLSQAVVKNEIAFLHAQIKPHFLYNALNTISALCEIAPDRAQDVTDELALYLRSRFDFGNLEKRVPLKKELEYIHAYLNVEKARFGERLNVEYEVEVGLDLSIPPLILQPLVENAVKHGLKARREGGRVRIAVKQEGARIVIAVSDNGMGMSATKVDEILKDTSGGGVGVRNVDQRLRKLYGNGLSITSVPGEGTTVVVVIPRKLER